jgi:hypothetical protein
MIEKMNCGTIILQDLSGMDMKRKLCKLQDDTVESIKAQETNIKLLRMEKNK